MEWIDVSIQKPVVNESIVLAINYHRTRRKRFWRKKIIVFGWLVQIKETARGLEMKFYDHTNNCYWKEEVSHWMYLPKPPEAA